MQEDTPAMSSPSPSIEWSSTPTLGGYLVKATYGMLWAQTMARSSEVDRDPWSALDQGLRELSYGLMEAQRYGRPGFSYRAGIPLQRGTMSSDRVKPEEKRCPGGVVGCKAVLLDSVSGWVNCSAHGRREPANATHWPDPPGHRSVVQGWLGALPFKQQAVLLVALRGCDGLPKHHGTKPVIRYLRSCVLNPADLDWRKNADPFFGAEPAEGAELAQFFRELDEVPYHFIGHLLHAAEIVGYKHPDPAARSFWNGLYRKLGDKLHLNPESEEQMDKRLARGSGG